MGVCVPRPSPLGPPPLGPQPPSRYGVKNWEKFKKVEQKDFQLLTNPDILNLFHKLSNRNIELIKILSLRNIRRFVQT